MSHRAPKQGNRLAADDVRIHAQPSNHPKLAPKKRQPTKTKRLPTAPKPPPDLVASKEILTLFQHTFSSVLNRPDLHSLLQTVKGHLFNRDYAAAFGEHQNLQAYIVRWSPSRALCYRSVFLELCEELKEVFDVAQREETTEIVCFGGGAGAELVAAAAAVKALLPRPDPRADAPPPQEITGRLHMTGVDIANWGEAFEQLHGGIKESFLPGDIFSADFVRADVLAADLAELVPRGTRLISMLFTTNELYTQSRAATTKMLLGLAGLVDKGCLLIVLESAGSYSMVKVGEKTFSMGMLLDHTLVGEEWEKIVEHEARWYRLPQAQTVNGQMVGAGLRYPLGLENMRYFVRVFRRL